MIMHRLYVDKLAEEILKNTFLRRRPAHTFSRSYVPNASSMGEGTIFFHIGSVHRLQTKARQLCSGHELAHYYLNHTNNGLQNMCLQYILMMSKRVEKNSKTAYGRNSQGRNGQKYLSKTADIPAN